MRGIEDELTKRNRTHRQVLTIRDAGEINVFDVPNAGHLAYYYDCHDLTEYICEDQTGYLNPIITGKLN